MPDFGGNIVRMQEFSALLRRLHKRVFKDDLPTHPRLYEAWLTSIKADQWIDSGLVTTGFGPMPEKAVGGPIMTDKPFISDPRVWEMTPYGLGYVAEYEIIRWDKYAVFTQMTRKLTRSGVDRMNVIAYAILNHSLDASPPEEYQVYHGGPICSTAQPLLRGGTARNRSASDVALSYLGMQEAITDFALLPNEDGLFIQLSPNKIVMHPSQYWVGKTLVGSDYRPDNANMSKNTLLEYDFGCHTAPYLSDTNRWWMLADKSKLEITFQRGDDLTLRDDFEISTWNHVFSIYGSFRVAVLHWYGVWGSAGA